MGEFMTAIALIAALFGHVVGMERGYYFAVLVVYVAMRVSWIFAKLEIPNGR